MFNKKTIIIISIIGIISFLVLLGYLIYSFKFEQGKSLFEKPVVTKQQALKLAEEFIKQFGLNAKNYPHRSIGYSTRNREVLYLLKIFGYKQAKKLIQEQSLPYACWLLNWGGISGESVSVDIDSQEDRVVSYEFWRSLSPDEKVTNLKEEEAKELAEKFLVSQGLDLSKLELLNVNKNTHNIREEYYFKWAKKDTNFDEASYVINLAVKADKIASYAHDLQLPDSYKYEYKNSQFISEFWLMLANGFSLLLGIVLMVMVIIRRKSLNWKLARLWAGSLALVFLVNFLNEQSKYVFFVDLIYKVIAVLFLSLVMFILIPITGHLFKESFGKDIFIAKNKTNILPSLIFCYALTFFSFAVVAGVYNLLGHFKLTWDAGSGGTVGKIFTSKIIHFAPFLLGIIPAFIEEFFRGFTMALSKKVFKRTFLAVVISAFFWGFAHTVVDGSFFPGYIVGIEKFVNGILVGYILLYFGIEVSILWHFLNNFLATNILLSLLGPQYMAYAIALSFLILLPFIGAIYLYFKKPAISTVSSP